MLRHLFGASNLISPFNLTANMVALELSGHHCHSITPTLRSLIPANPSVKGLLLETLAGVAG